MDDHNEPDAEYASLSDQALEDMADGLRQNLRIAESYMKFLKAQMRELRAMRLKGFFNQRQAGEVYRKVMVEVKRRRYIQWQNFQAGELGTDMSRIWTEFQKTNPGEEFK